LNPNAEIDPELPSMRSGICRDGKSVNNVLGFPGFARCGGPCHRISHEMYLAAAETIADMTPADELVPNPLDIKVHQAVARASQAGFRAGLAQ
jgi:malate dehydrogenase (oxaloacetate-decarboxylating)